MAGGKGDDEKEGSTGVKIMVEKRKGSDRHEPWELREDGSVSLEHASGIRAANQLIASVNSFFPDIIPSLDKIEATDMEDDALLLGKTRFERKVPIGDIDGHEYMVTVSRVDRLGESSQDYNIKPDEIAMVPVGDVRIHIEPVKSEEGLRESFYGASITISRFGDEEKPRPAGVLGIVPISDRTAKIQGGELSISFSVFDPTYVQKQPLGLNAIANNREHPDLGDNALRGIRRVMEQAKSAMTKSR